MKISRFPRLGLLGVMTILSVTSASFNLFAEDDNWKFMVKAGESPWSDRIGVWQLANVPASLDGNGPYLRQNCGSRSIVVPDNTTHLILGVSNKDVDRFKTDFPTAQATGDTISVTHSDGTGTIPYTIFKVTNPPGSIGDTNFLAGLILLQVNDKPAAGPKPNAPNSK